MVKPAVVAAFLLAVPALAISACSPNQNPATTTGTTPSVWTGSPSPGSTPSSSVPTSGSAASAGGRKLTAELTAADGTKVATATFEFTGSFAVITVDTVGPTILEPGFHGLHIHKVGQCTANSVAPTGGPPGDFLSAGGHFQAPGHDGHPASGDLSSLQVRADRTARLVTTSDAFTADQLLEGAGTALIIHADEDNFVNVPTRYTQPNGQTGPDEQTMNTGDAGARVACGVIRG